MKKSIALCLVVALMLTVAAQTFFCAYAAQEKITYEMREEHIQFKLSNGTVYYTNTITYPYFLGNTAAEIKINQKYAAIIEECRNNTTDFDILYKYEKKSNPNIDNYLPYYEDVAAEITYCKNGLISIKQRSTMWSGGAHPYSGYVGYTYRVNDGTELALSDILAGSESEQKALVKRYNKGGASFFKPEMVLASPYMLTEDGLCFLCNVGDAVPRVEVIIPYTEEDSFLIFSPQTVAIGDLNDDGELDMRDAFAIYSAASGGDELTEQQLAAADMNGDGEIDMRDAFALYQTVSGG